jgi:uncharacterized protein (TIGR03067 family)
MLQLLALASFVVAAPPEDAVRREHENFNGNWRLVSVEVEGQKMPAQQANELSLTFKAGKFTSFRGGEKRTGKYTLDPTHKLKTIDIVHDDGPDKGKPWSLIYSLEGNTLRICCREIGKDRPTNFDTKDQKDVILMVLRHED